MKKYIAVLTFFICVSSLAYFFLNNADKKNSELSQDSKLPDAASVKQLGLIDLLYIENSIERQRQLESFFAEQMLNRPFETIETIKQLNDSSHRRLCFKIALLLWVDTNRGQFHQWLSEMIPNVDLDKVLVTLIERNKSNHRTALIYAEKIADTSKHQSFISNILKVWVLDKPDQAIEWALSQSEGSEAWIALLFQTLTTQAPILAISSLSQLEGAGEELLNLAIAAVVSNLAGDQVNDDLIAAIIALDSYNVHESLVAALIESLENSGKEKDQMISLAHLAELIETLLPGEAQGQLRKLLAQSWAKIDPYAAAEYAESLDGEARIFAADGVVATWSKTDPGYASEWLETMEGNIDIPANTLARGAANVAHMEVADRWLNNIKDAKLRNKAINDVVNEWYAGDPRTGLHYLVYQKSLSEQQKLGFLHQVYPDRVFISSKVAYEQLSSDGSLRYEYNDGDDGDEE